MKNGIKLGFGLVIGYCLGVICLNMTKDGLMKWATNNKDFMEYEKEKNPERYEELRKCTK